jgi:hypothetical protein
VQKIVLKAFVILAFELNQLDLGAQVIYIPLIPATESFYREPGWLPVSEHSG